MSRKKPNQRIRANQGEEVVTHQEHEQTPDQRNMAVAEAIVRTQLTQALGQSYDGKRDIYSALGLPKTVSPKMMENLYARGGIFHRAAEIFPSATWREDPDVYEDSDPDNETEFERMYNQLIEDVPIWAACKKADVGMGLGRFSILLLGFRDGKKLSEPVENVPAGGLAYVHPYREPYVTVDTWDEVETSERFNKPLTYKITPSKGGQKGTQIVVHFSRVVHMAEKSLDNDTFAEFSPLKAIYNYAFLLDMVMGGSAEAYWRGGFPGISFEADKDAVIDRSAPAKEERDKQFSNYTHGFQRYLSLHGMKANTLASNIESPKDVKDALVTLIAGTLGVPKRKLEGSERGELSSSEDSTDFKERTQERRKQWAAPMLAKVLIRRFINVGVLPTPGTFKAEWPKAQLLTRAEQATIAKTNAEALAAYANSPGAHLIISPRQFVEDMLGMEYEDPGNPLIDEEDAQAKRDEEEARLLAEEEAAAGDGGAN